MVELATIRRGCIYWVNFDPVMGSGVGKSRPGLVVQNNLGNLSSSTIIVVAITSRIPSKHYPMHVPLPGGLLGKPGTIMCEHIRTVSVERVDDRILAECPPELMEMVDEAVRHSLGLSSETGGTEITARDQGAGARPA
jgi:mRNA interferase MazF